MMWKLHVATPLNSYRNGLLKTPSAIYRQMEKGNKNSTCARNTSTICLPFQIIYLHSHWIRQFSNKLYKWFTRLVSRNYIIQRGLGKQNQHLWLNYFCFIALAEASKGTTPKSHQGKHEHNNIVTELMKWKLG